jgi:hypothetical protein
MTPLRATDAAGPSRRHDQIGARSRRIFGCIRTRSGEAAEAGSREVSPGPLTETGTRRSMPKIGRLIARSKVFTRAAELPSVRIVFKHGRQRDVQGFANVDQSRRTDAVYALFIFLNLLKRDAQFPTQLCLAHIKREPLLAHPSADASVHGACASRRQFFRSRSLHLRSKVKIS